MNGRAAIRLLLGALVAAGVALSGLGPAPQSAVQAAVAPPPARETLRVGLWTLWRDREVKLTPAAPGGRVTLRTCAVCGELALAGPAEVRADGGAVTLAADGRTSHADRIWVTGPVTLTAHNESVTLHNPVAIMYRASTRDTR